MSSSQQNNVPKKGDIVINPKTSRPVRVGSRVWLTLVREGLVDGHYSDPKTLYEVKDDSEYEEKISELNQQLPINQQAVRGRGCKYKNKIVKRHKQPSTRQVSQHTVRTTAKKLKDPQVYDDLMESKDFESQLEQLIMAELANGGGPPERGDHRYYEEEDENDYVDNDDSE